MADTTVSSGNQERGTFLISHNGRRSGFWEQSNRKKSGSSGGLGRFEPVSPELAILDATDG